MENYYADEMTIDLMDVVFFFLKKWKAMIAMLLIFAVLGGGYAALKPAAAPVEYVPKAEVLEQMEQASQARERYENALKNDTADLTEINNGRVLMEALEKAFTGDALTYYQVNFQGMAAPKVESGYARTIKFAVIGAFLGVVLWGVWYLVAYLANSTIKTADELSASYGITLLGRIEASEKKDFVTKWQEKMKRPAATESYLAAVIDGAQEGQAALCGDQTCEEVKALAASLEKACGKVKGCGFISESEEALKQVKEAQSEILVVRTWKTKRDQIKRELEMCRVQNVKILGMIVID